MRTNRKAFPYDRSTLETLLRCEARIDSDHLMSSVRSFGFKDVEECAPTGVHDRLGKLMVLDHIDDRQLLNGNMVIGLNVLLGHVEMEVTALPIDLEMCLGHVLRGLPPSMTALLASAHLPLFASQGVLRGAIEARIVNGVALRVGQEGFQPNIKADIRVLTSAWSMLDARGRLAYDQGIPMSVGSQHEMNHLGLAFHRTVELNFEQFAQFGRHMHVFVVFIQPGVTARSVLPELDGVPLVALLETRKAHFLLKFFAGKKAFECFAQSISQRLYRGGWYRLSTTAFESGSQIVLRGECAVLLILCLDSLQHLIVNEAGLDQALH